MFCFGIRATFVGRLIHDLYFPLAGVAIKAALSRQVTNVLPFILSAIAKYVNLFYKSTFTVKFMVKNILLYSGHVY